MNIETKHNIGDEVWFLCYGKIFNDIIERRMIVAIGDQRDDM